MEKNLNCAPALWRKLNEKERKLWNAFYEGFNLKVNLPPTVHISSQELHVIAHNFACQAIWTMQELEKK